MPDARIGVVGATGAVGSVTLALLAERGYTNVRAFASARSAGGSVQFGARELLVEEATPEALAAGDLFGTPVCCLHAPVAGSGWLVARTEKLGRATGWRPAVPIVEGLARTAAWFRREAVGRA